MQLGRRGIDEFLYKTRELISGDTILELCAGMNPFLTIMFAEKEFLPTDKNIYPGSLPGTLLLDAENFGREFSEREWDAIYFCESLEHCKRPWLVFKEVYKHLSSGGVFVVTAPCCYPIHEATIRDGDDEILFKDYWRVTPSGFALLFTEAGFLEFYVEPLFHFNSSRNKPYSVVGWGRKLKGQMWPGQLLEWTAPLPDDWVVQHSMAEEKWLNCQKGEKNACNES